ncbi:hypothetical protein E2C01_015964 [Portunus trituberculatus]|uniref:Uncharacterized protein n=1 Tax=Portunus trituberculatus TaxID=210409 RepID=A0A5B7DNZ5_PORTR|nr:hypothetical protein [Portunus trituberculatus]
MGIQFSKFAFKCWVKIRQKVSCQAESITTASVLLPGTAGCALPQLSGEDGVDVSSDSAVSSLSPDEPWSSLDHTTQPSDSGNRNQSGDYNNTGSYRYAAEDPHRMPPIPLKKQHMFGRGKKKYF